MGEAHNLHEIDKKTRYPGKKKKKRSAEIEASEGVGCVQAV